MKKRCEKRRRTSVPVVFLLFMALSPVVPAAAKTVDAVVMLDTSSSMFSYFDDTREYLIERILTEQLTTGDGFHLLSFADTPEYEISRKMKDIGEIEAVAARLMLLQPLGRYTDLVAAFKKLYDYVSDLPLETQKEIFILTDGIHDPPPGSPYPVSGRNSDDVADIAASMRRNGWNVHIIRFPSGAASDSGAGAGAANGSGGNNLLPAISRELDTEAVPYDPEENGFVHKATGQLEIIFPDTLGNIRDRFALKLTVVNHIDEPASIRIEQLLVNGVESLEKAVSEGVKAGERLQLKLNARLPETVQEGDQLLELEIILADGGRAFPRKASVPAEIARTPGRLGNGSPVARYILYAAAALVVLIVLVLMVGRLFGSTAGRDHVADKEPAAAYGLSRYEKEEVPLEAAGESMSESAELLARFGSSVKRNAAAEELMSYGRDRGKELPARSAGRTLSAGRSSGLYSLKEIRAAREEGRVAVELVVHEQNRMIGKRNIKWLREGESLRVGGANGSPFIIFLYPVPPVIGTLARSGASFTFTPEPESAARISMGPGPVTGALDRPIVYRLNENVSVEFRFHLWESPLERINNFLHVIDRPGLPGKATLQEPPE